MRVFYQAIFSSLLVLSSLDLAQLSIIDAQESLRHLKKFMDDTPEWDLLIFTQQWPPTVCIEWKEHNEKHTCSMPTKVDSWTIHGIWPTKYHTLGPQFCNRTWHFDPEAIRPIEPSLTQYWTNIEAGTSLYSFWAHEWNKHGTCAAILEPLNSEFKYFSKGLQFLDKFSMLDILKDANIFPSDTKEYSIIEINNAIKERLGINPAIECRKIEGKSVLIEIRICFDKSLNIANCDGVVGLPTMYTMGNIKVLTNCPENEGIIYPESPNNPKNPDNYYNRDYDEQVREHSRYIVQLYKLANWLQWLTL